MLPHRLNGINHYRFWLSEVVRAYAFWWKGGSFLVGWGFATYPGSALLAYPLPINEAKKATTVRHAYLPLGGGEWNFNNLA